MDPATINMAVQLGIAAFQTIQQYTSGAITQEQAHQQLIDASSGLISAIDTFNAAGQSVNQAAS